MIKRRPQHDEYPVFATGYVAAVGDNDPIELLKTNQLKSYELFSPMTEAQANHTYFPGKWTIRECLGHMLDTERVFSYRILCLSRGETKELPGFDQDVYAVNAGYENRPIAEIATEFKLIREANLHLVTNLSDAQFERRGIASGFPVSVLGLVTLLAGHEQHHLNILKERYL